MKQDYKAYLEMIADNVERLLATHKEDKRVATNNDPLTKHGVAEKLQGGMTRQLEMTHAEHGRILAQQYAFQAERSR